ncbi:penicillin acylase family protein [bacterium]|nr:penicillin acylase family protein [bacterium]
MTKGSWIKMFGVLVTLLALALFAPGCSCGDDDDDDDGGVPTDDDDDDTEGDDDADDDDDSSPVLDYPVDETIELPGMTGEARVAVDSLGIPYVFAESDLDLARVLGYVEASYRIFQMDFLRRLAQGRIAEIAGSIAIDTDVYQRAAFMSSDGTSVLDKIEDDLDPALNDYIHAYAEGVNAWLADIREMWPAEETPWPEEYGFVALSPDQVPDWTVRDTLSIARYQTWDLSESLGDDMTNTERADALGAALYAKAFPTGIAEDTTVLKDGDMAKKSAPYHAGQMAKVLPDGFKGLSRAIARVREAKEWGAIAGAERRASNNWTLSPDINGGVGFLANDPHLSLTFPSIFILGYMDTKELGGGGGVRAWGSIFPGTPLVVIGANDNLAWGETVAGYDVLDVYAENVNFSGDEPVSVDFDGGTVPVIKVSEEFYALHDDTPEMRDIYLVPHHGPIIPDSIDTDAETALSFRWTGHEPTQEAKAFDGLHRAGDVTAGLEAVDNFKVGAQNFVLQDTQGNIGYFPNANVPNRDWDLDTYKPWFVLPGDGSAEWDGFIPASDVARIQNPDRGWIATANNDIYGTLVDGNPINDEHYWYVERAIGFRAARIEALLDEQMNDGGFTLDSMMATQLDIYWMYAARWLEAVLDIIGDPGALPADQQDALEYLANWSGNAVTGLDGDDPASSAPSSDEDERNDAVAAMIFAEFESQLIENTFADEFDDAGLDSVSRSEATRLALLWLLEAGVEDDVFDDTSTGGTEDRRDTVLAALADALAAIPTYKRRDLDPAPAFDGVDMDEWFWGRLHVVSLSHIAFDPFGIDIFNRGPFARSGGLYTVNVANASGLGGYTVGSGPSLRIIHQFEDGAITTWAHIPGGMKPVAGDPNELDLMQMWLDGEYYEMPHAPQPILDATVTMKAFVPES